MFHAVRQQLFGVFFCPRAADDDAVHIIVYLGSKLPGFANQLVDYRMDRTVFLLGVNQNTLPFVLVKRTRHLFKLDCLLGTGLNADRAHAALFIRYDAGFLHVERSEGTLFNAFPA